MGVTLNHNGGGDAQQPFLLAAPGLFAKFVDDHGRGIGQLVAGQAKQLFPNRLTGQKFLAAIGQFIFSVPPGLLGQKALAQHQQSFYVAGIFSRHRDKFSEGMALLHLLQPGRNVAAAVDLVELVGHQQRRNIFAKQAQHTGISLIELTRLHHKQDQVNIAHSAQHRLVERAVQSVVVAGLEARGVNKHELGRALGAHTGNPVPGGLRLARGDADFLAYKCIEQG